MLALAVVTVTLSLSGCVPAPSASPAPSPSPTRTTGPGGYDDLAQACTAIADDLITLRTIRGSVEIGVDRDGGEAILERLDEMRSLAPLSLSGAYRSVETAIERLASQVDASPTPTSSATRSGAPELPQTATPTPTSTPQASISDVVDSATDDITAWLRNNCDGS
ncbi:hypothetical protein M3D75_13235 [Microbacterium enclense]|uniref:hypothetical protein n=1 Tax=Microbacterium enclense TaxID=993073 RepID=UPI0021A557F6|nr:hypothetical protein [Microbacterium enclense]MCT2087080.1 hypothetical protein [Microbacterium enclense]